MRWIFVDKIIEMDPGKSAVAVRNFSRSELFFLDHFPGFPLVPGVLQIEMIAQLSGKCIMAGHPGIMPVLGSVKSAKFYHKIVPGDQAVIKVEVTVRKSFSMAQGQVEVDGSRVSAAEVILAHLPASEDLIRKKMAGNGFGDWLQAGGHGSDPMV
ncbi:MAG: 3-hydroxyacyl-ACP dehydratase FabZ family protein [Thermodesulfovibrionales bacterium]